MSSHECEEDINLVTNAGRQANNTNSLHGVKQTHEQDSEECNLINSDNSGSECSSPSKETTGVDKSVRNAIERSSFNNSESYSTSFEIKRESSEDKDILSDSGGMENLNPNQQFTLSNDKEMSSSDGNGMPLDSPSSGNQSLTALQHSSTSNDSTNTKIENSHCYGSPFSDITDPEIAQVNSHEWVSRDSSRAEKTWLNSESPSSDVECSSSCAEDSGISSTVRDDEMEEIPLADGTLSPELFHEMTKLNVTDMVSSWVPKSNNTYSPNVHKEPQASHVGRKPGNDQNTAGWKLFGRVPPKETNKTQSFQRGDIVRRSLERTLSRKTKLPSLKKSNSSLTSSTTALIFENRPRNLPAKSPTEEKKHRQQYEAMVAQARKKELQEVKKHERQLKQKDKQEKQIVSAATVWLNEILPNWETMRGSRKAKELWWQGIPPSVRGRVWKLAIGNDLQITYELFDIFQAHAFEKLIVTRNNKKRLKQSKSVAELPTNNFIPVVSSEHKVELIMLDVSRTFPSLCIFQEGGPFHDLLHSILGAYTCYRPDVGYVQGMSFIAAVLLLNMDPPDAFVCFANLLNKPCQLVFFRVDHPMMKAYFATFEILLEEFLPKIASLFVEENFSPDMYLIDWIFTLFSKSLPLDVACRVWDVFCRDGDDFLFRTALGILKYYQHDLVGMDFIHLGQFLSKLPDDISPSKLFENIGAINLTRQKFNQILTQQKELATQIKSVTASAGK